jgi:hypothetical protein
MLASSGNRTPFHDEGIGKGQRAEAREAAAASRSAHALIASAAANPFNMTARL